MPTLHFGLLSCGRVRSTITFIYDLAFSIPTKICCRFHHTFDLSADDCQLGLEASPLGELIRCKSVDPRGLLKRVWIIHVWACVTRLHLTKSTHHCIKARLLDLLHVGEEVCLSTFQACVLLLEQLKQPVFEVTFLIHSHRLVQFLL